MPSTFLTYIANTTNPKSSKPPRGVFGKLVNGNEMVSDDRKELISRHLSNNFSVESELALLSAQAADKQEVVEERLRAIDDYLKHPDATVTDVDAAAARIGVSRRQFYRLLAKMRVLGPVRALVPGLQNVARASAAREGLAEPIEAVVVEALLREPDARITKIQGLVADRCVELGLAPPTEWMLRQRVHALRANGPIDPGAQFGSRIVVDQVSLDLPVQHFDVARFGTLTAIIDRSTRLVLGASILPGDGIGIGLAEALSDMRRTRMPAFKKQGFPVAPQLSELTWVAPPGLESLASAIVSNADGQRPEVNVISEGPRRHGELILRLLGDRLGPYSIRSRTPLEANAERASGGGNSLESAHRMVGYCVDAWNRKLLLQLPAVLPEDTPRHSRRLERIAKQVEAIFAPVMEEVSATPKWWQEYL